MNVYWEHQRLRELEANIYDWNLAQPYSLKYINAKVPIVKFIDAQTGLSVDICIGKPQQNSSGVLEGPGLLNSRVIREFLREYRLLKPLILALKFYMKEKRINVTYDGGMGSYLLVLLAVALLQAHNIPRRSDQRWRQQQQQQQEDEYIDEPYAMPTLAMHEQEWLGKLFLDFFRIYGVEFNVSELSISLRDGGSLQPKPYSADALISVIDPARPDNDVGSGCWNFIAIRAQLKTAFRALTAPIVVAGKRRSVLSAILPILECTPQGGSSSSSARHPKQPTTTAPAFNHV
eukprot:TRINITY_DN2595_c2_g1_i1.p1 TRINITY_DN2595_c2_g1~~TRINITY_DN2595_c2_g1_i1.p1  ORF type:complete len:290 (-),score=40.20 TRINITY_DN2595_c2_g1_i1:75-944(-)